MNPLVPRKGLEPEPWGSSKKEQEVKEKEWAGQRGNSGEDHRQQVLDSITFS